MTTQVTNLIRVHPWGTGERVSRRRPSRAIGVLPDRFARDVAGGLLVLGSWAALWTWFLVATW